MARMTAIDAINARYGGGAVAFGMAGERPVWGLRREFISPRYTTVGTNCYRFNLKKRQLTPCRIRRRHFKSPYLVVEVFQPRERS
jgi:Domain of unknown function (DUF4113)